MIIREAGADDQDAVVALAREFLASTPYRLFPPAPGRLEALFQTLQDLGVVFVAERGQGELVGFLALALVEHPWTGAPYTEELAWWVTPGARGGPAGLRLLAAAENWSRQRHAFCLRMGSPFDSPGVARVYTRRGYQPVETAYMLRL